MEAPRWLSHPGTDTKDLGDPLELRIEETAGHEVIERLRAIGHHVTLLPALEGGGGGQLIRIDPETGVREGGSDLRLRRGGHGLLALHTIGAAPAGQPA